MKLTLLITIALFLTTALYCQTTALPPSNFGQENAGTQENPYLISNLANLRWLSETRDVWGQGEWNQEVNKFVGTQKNHFTQTSDIDASETINWNNGEGFSRIGDFMYVNSESIGDYFWGNYLGNNFTISNIYINPDLPHGTIASVGMFGIVLDTKISGLRLVDANVQSHGFVGLVAGALTDSHLLFSSTSGYISSTSPDHIQSGGLVGTANRSIIEKCFSTATVNGNNSASLGGLIGKLSGSTVINSFFYGIIQEGTSVGLVLNGGLVAYADDSLIQNCYTASAVAFEENIVALVDYMDYSIMNACIWNTSLTLSYFPIRVNRVSILQDNIGVTTDTMRDLSFYISLGWDFENIWDIDPEINNGFPFLRGLPNPIVSEFEPHISISKPTFELLGNYPNPFNPETTISFILQADNHVSIDIFNIRGQKVKSLVNEFKASGNHKAIWNGTDENGFSVSSCIYFYRMQTNDFTETKRMLLLK